jgi:hypothetical protein
MVYQVFLLTMMILSSYYGINMDKPWDSKSIFNAITDETLETQLKTSF